LANNYYGEYDGGHGIRRGGNGIFPPATANSTADFTDRSNKAVMKSAHFPTNFEKRIKIKPGTNALCRKYIAIYILGGHHIIGHFACAKTTKAKPPR
jgi:hypothetical protein